MGSTFHSVHVHVVFTCKERQPMLTPEIQKRLYPYIAGILRNRGHFLVEGGGIADHAHLLIAMAMTQSVSDMLRDLKANTSKWIHQTWPNQDFGWQDGYGAFSVSMSGVAKTREYIRNQEIHHRTQTTQQELQKFAELHGMKMNEDGSFEKVDPLDDKPEERGSEEDADDSGK